MKQAKKYSSSGSMVMSKLKKMFFALFIAVLCALFFVCGASAQDLAFRITVSENQSKIEVKGAILVKNRIKLSRYFTFVNSAKSAGQTTDRVKNLAFFDELDRPVPFTRLKLNEFLTDSEVYKFKYEIDFEPETDFVSKAHSSWLENDGGILMLRDLIPQFELEDGTKLSATVKIDAPGNSNELNVSDVDSGVFIVGSNWRTRKILIERVEVNFAINGVWKFSDSEAVELITEILSEWKNSFGGFPFSQIQITFVPVADRPGRWEAETRANSLTVVSGDMTFRKPSLQRLHEQLRHELLHFWVPNGLALTGNYDWFYEGFSIYQSLRTGVKLNRLSFEDFLKTLSEAYQIVHRQSSRISLLDASKTNNSGRNQRVYAEGMLVGFFCDVAMLKKSKGKRSVSQVIQRAYQEHRLPNKLQDGNIAILHVLSSYSELAPIIDDYINGTKEFNWDVYLNDLGLEQLPSDSSFQLNVKAQLNGRQKDLLDKLGYNNWRKLGKNSK